MNSGIKYLKHFDEHITYYLFQWIWNIKLVILLFLIFITSHIIPVTFKFTVLAQEKWWLWNHSRLQWI